MHHPPIGLNLHMDAADWWNKTDGLRQLITTLILIGGYRTKVSAFVDPGCMFN
jgi:hypothetical protein